MTDPVFLTALPDPLPAVGAALTLDGDEGRHAVTVRRIRPGERVVLADGAGRGVVGTVTATAKTSLTVEVTAHRSAPPPALTVTAVQALAKGERSELAVELMTELGVDRIVPWQASRSIVRWRDDGSGSSRADKSRGRWEATVREAAKQSRRLRIPTVDQVHDTAAVARLIGGAALGLVLHESASVPLAGVDLPATGELVIVIGPEGGISDDEIAAFTDATATAVLLGDTVLRSSTAGAAALAQLAVLAPPGARAAR